MLKVKQEHGYKKITLPDGRTVALFPNGKAVPCISGASGEGDPSAESGGTDGSGGNPGDGAKKIEFDADQQAKLQSLVDDAYTKAYKKARGEYDTKIAKSNDDITQLRTQIEELNKKPAETPAGTEEAKKAIDLINKQKEALEVEMKLANESFNNERTTNALYGAIGKHDVVDNEAIVTLIRGMVAIGEDGKPFVKGDGGPKLNNHGEPQTVENFVEEWLRERPHFLKGSAGGAGSNSSMGGNAGNGSVQYDLSDPEVVRNLPADELDRLIKEGIVIKNPNGTSFKFGTVTNPFTEARRRKFKRENR